MIHSDPILLDSTGRKIVEAIGHLVPAEKTQEFIDMKADVAQLKEDTANLDDRLVAEEDVVSAVEERTTALEKLNLSIVDGRVCITYSV